MNKFLEQYWWKTANTDDVKAELGAGVDVMAWGKGEDGLTALHLAALPGKAAFHADYRCAVSERWLREM